jgi:hypothetical protein
VAGKDLLPVTTDDMRGLIISSMEKFESTLTSVKELGV